MKYIINEKTDKRNSMLQGWKQGGGPGGYTLFPQKQYTILVLWIATYFNTICRRITCLLSMVSVAVGAESSRRTTTSKCPVFLLLRSTTWLANLRFYWQEWPWSYRRILMTHQFVTEQGKGLQNHSEVERKSLLFFFWKMKKAKLQFEICLALSTLLRGPLGSRLHP